MDAKSEPPERCGLMLMGAALDNASQALTMTSAIMNELDSLLDRSVPAGIIPEQRRTVLSEMRALQTALAHAHRHAERCRELLDPAAFD